jgi:hypothetical protein
MMPRKPIMIEIAMDSGPSHYWKLMLAAGQKGFTIRSIALASDGVAYKSVKRYVDFLKAEGYVARVGSKQDGYATQAVYAVKKRVNKPPIKRPAGKEEPFTARQAMWNAMRTLNQFSVNELAKAASIEERHVAQHTADNYIRALLKVGVLIAVEAPQRLAGKGSTPGVYRLAPRANTGPQAPKLCKANFVFDMNTRKPLGEAVVTEARA